MSFISTSSLSFVEIIVSKTIVLLILSLSLSFVEIIVSKDEYIVLHRVGSFSIKYYKNILLITVPKKPYDPEDHIDGLCGNADGNPDSE